MKKLSSSLLALALFAGSIFGMSSCGKYLDENSDGRYVDGNTPYKISRFLTYAYPLASLAHISELSSDNTYEDETRNLYREEFQDLAVYWKPVTTTDGSAYYDGPLKLWEASYYAIAQANEVLTLIEETKDYGDRNMASRGEALAVRAWSHFQLANVFCLPYNFDGQGGATNLGVPYVAERVTTILPDYPRGTLKETYEKIEKDLLEAILFWRSTTSTRMISATSTSLLRLPMPLLRASTSTTTSLTRLRSMRISSSGLTLHHSCVTGQGTTRVSTLLMPMLRRWLTIVLPMLRTSW